MEKTKLRIHIWGEKILRKKCRQVKKVTPHICQILDEMYSLMCALGGVGLAANQAGIDLSLVVIKIEDKVFKLINPSIVKKEGKIEGEEGCLSFPGLNLKVRRAEKVWVCSLNEKGNLIDIEAEGILSVALQHEIDHIRGVLFIDRVPFRERMKLREKLNTIRKRGRL